MSRSRIANYLPWHWPTFLLALCMFFTGASGLVAEYALATVSTYILGNAIEQVGITFGVMMLMMGVGGWLQRHVSDRYLIEKFIGLEILLAVLIGYAPICIYAAFGAMEHHFHLIQYFFITAIGLLIGFEIPLATRVNEHYQPQLRSNIGTIFSMDYIGAFAGSLVWIWLIRNFPLTEISFLMASCNLVVAAITLGYFFRYLEIRQKIVPIAAMMLAMLATTYGYFSNRNWNVVLEQRLYNNPIILAHTSPYQRLVVTQDKELGEYRFYINGNLQFSSLDEKIYHEQLVHPAMTLAPSREKVLILGGGDGLALREVQKYPDVESVTLVDLDPDMVKICSTNPYLRKLNRDAFDKANLKIVNLDLPKIGSRRVFQKDLPIAQVNVYHIDADKLIEKISDRWNVVIIDFPDPNSIELAKLYSKEFYLKLRNCLTPDAVVVVQSTSPYHAKEAYLCILRTMAAAGFNVLPYHESVPSFGDWGWILAWDQSISHDQMRQKIGNLRFSVPTDHLNPEVFAAALVFGKGLLIAKFNEINTLMRPVLLDYYTRHSWRDDENHDS